MDAAQSLAVSIALFAGMTVSLFIAIALPLVMSGERWKAAEEKAKARRLADARMNARLLKLNL